MDILVVDHEPLIVQLFRGYLKRTTDYQVTTTLRSIEALELVLVAKRHFDLIFLELFMPRFEGAEVFHRIREIEKQVPIVIMTGSPDSDLLRRARELGPFAVVIKPFKWEEIANIIGSLSNGYQAKGELEGNA